MDGELKSLVCAMLNALIPASDILSCIQQKFPESSLVLKDIHNLRTETYKVDPFICQTVDELIKNFHGKNCFVEVNWNTLSHITHLMSLSFSLSGIRNGASNGLDLQD
ncbi:hypothetical protein GEMRC1_005665 [Eukaryota sp. GEM-RC1]